MLRACEITAADLDGDSDGAKRSSAPFLKALHELSRMSHSWMDGSCLADDEMSEGLAELQLGKKHDLVRGHGG